MLATSTWLVPLWVISKVSYTSLAEVQLATLLNSLGDKAQNNGFLALAFKLALPFSPWVYAYLGLDLIEMTVPWGSLLTTMGGLYPSSMMFQV